MTLARLRHARRAHLDRREARARLRTLERAFGRRVGAADARRARSYATEVLGDGRYAATLAGYTLLAGRWRDGWLPQAFVADVVIPHVSGDAQFIGAGKSLAGWLLRSPAFPDLLRLVHGRYLDAAGAPVTDAQARALLGDPEGHVVLKPDGLLQGRGIAIQAARDVDLGAFAAAARHGVIQRRIIPHPLFTAVAPDAATTLRLQTVREPDGAFTLRAALVKFVPLCPSARGFTIGGDRFRWPIDVASGQLGPTVHDAFGRPFGRHPHGGVPVVPTPVPGFAAARALALDLHARAPQLGLIAWDLMIDPEERAWLLEWNTRSPALDLIEPLRGPSYLGLGWDRLRPLGRT